MKDKKLDYLAEQLYSKINDNNDFFTTKMVIVPSNKMASYLKAYFLKNNQDKVLMNVLFMTFNKALERLFNLDYEIASTNQIRDILIKYLNDPNNINGVLMEYLKNRNAGDYYIKLFNIANELTDLFNKEEDDHSMNNINDYKNEYNYLKTSLNSKNLATLRMLMDDKIISKDKIEEDYDVYVFGFIEHSNLEKEIIKELSIKEEYLLNSTISKEETSKLSIIKAPSKLREIEYLHSEVCKLLKKKDVRYTDILVVGPNMSEYENTISRVFNQDGDKFPNVSYYVNAAVAKNNNVYNALLTIKEIVNKGFFSRLDFDNIITNNAIKYVRKITDEDINNYRASISDMNSYYKEDWEYAKKRLLISKISDINSDNNIVDVNGESLPYSRIGLDDDAIVRFIKIIDDLNDLIELFNASSNTSADFLEKFNNALDTFLSIKDENGEETNGYYKKVDKVNKYWKDNEIYDVPKRTYLESLIDASKRNITKSGDLYLSGVSFTDFDKDFALSAKYIFFINASSDNLPIKKEKNALNKNEVISYNEEKKAFEALYNNCEHLYVSYVSKDLKTDEDFFLSNFVKELTDPLIDEIIKKNTKKIGVFDEEYLDSISIDEDGTIKEIFTRRGKRNSEFRKKLLGGNGSNGSSGGDTQSSIINVTKQNIQTNVKTSELGSFLEEPLKSKASRLFGSSDDTMENVAKEYPPYELDALNRSIVFKEICILLLNSNKNEKVARDEIKKSFDLRKQIPSISNDIEESILDELFDDYHSLKEYVSQFGKPTICDEQMDLDITYDGSKPNSGNPILLNKAPFTWALSNNTPFIKVENDDVIYYFPIKLEERQKNKDVLTMLVIALMDCVINKYSGKEVVLCPFYKNKNSKELHVYGLNEKEAIKRINLIYELFVDYRDNYLFSYDYIDEDNYKTIKDDYYKLVKKVKDVWEYFEDKNLFDWMNDLGYDDRNYKEEIDSEGKVSGKIAIIHLKYVVLMNELLGKAEGEENE